MTWFKPPLTEERSEVVDPVADVAPNLPALTDAGGAADPAWVAAARGAGQQWPAVKRDRRTARGRRGPLDLRQAALIALGLIAPALYWASAQAESVTHVIAAAQGLAELCGDVVDGRQAELVVELGDPHVRLTLEADDVPGTIGRIDPDGPNSVVAALDGPAVGWMLLPAVLSEPSPLRRTGSAGARTATIGVDASDDAFVGVDGLDLAPLRAALYTVVAAIAAGIAVAAAEGALPYSRERIQFGAPLTALPTVRASRADQSYAASAAVLAALVDRPGRVEHAAAVLHETCVTAIEVGGAALQSHGGYGDLDVYDAERLLRDAVSLQAATGAWSALRRVADALENPCGPVGGGRQ